MDHFRAESVFKEIQARPYRVGSGPHETPQNCYFKGIELIQRLAVMGYAVRGRVAETYWDNKIIPGDIIKLIPDDLLVTHFFTEIYIDDKWRILDPSFQPNLNKYGFTIGSFTNGKSCFPIKKLYTQEESLNYQDLWFNKEYQDDWYAKSVDAWIALDKWFEEIS